MLQEITTYITDPSYRTQISLVTFVLTLICAKIILNLVRENNLPPGPIGVPVLGYLPFFGTHPHLTFNKLREKYGDIFSIKMGSFPAIVISGKALIKETLVTRGDDFSGRPNFYLASLFGEHTLTFGRFSESSILHKKMAYNCLYVFANSRKNPTEDMIYEEAKITVSEFNNMSGKPFCPTKFIYVSVGSIIFQICFGKHTNIREEDETFKTFLKNNSELIQFAASGNPVDVMPWLRYVMPWKVSTMIKIDEQVREIRSQKVEESLKTYTSSNLRHVADGLIAAVKEADADPSSDFTAERIYSTLDDLLGAGFETVSNTLNWALLLLTAHPEVQRMVHEEIDDVLGQRQPKLEDKAEMHYCMATIHEILRFSNIAPLSLPHAATKDTELNGYIIPKDTVILLNIYSISHDEKLWGDPLNFRPGRFLDAEGKLDNITTDKFTAFSMGRRKCVGEFLARMELFLFFTGIFQNCVFSKPAHIKEYSFDSVFGLTLSPVPYEICASMRE
ncbi:hypothetical protein SNE40_008204 [Patella caerulea]|uniref:unspecific monooxygenase n=2 Tax=Patella caerulea TaxID=87958 RepID=A0AAN8PW85_PATCE